MVAYQHPTELNLFQQYRQAASILRGTSRATNDGWYQHALDVDFQVHLRIDGSARQAWCYHRPSDTWSPGPQLQEEFFQSTDKVPAFAADVVAMAKKAGASSAAVVLHIADEFATTEIKPELDNPGALAELRDTIVTDPKSVLDDSSLPFDEHSWRLVPYNAPGAESIATAVTLSRDLSGFITALRTYGASTNFPVRTLAASAPLIGLLTLPELKRSPNEKPFLAVLTYARFTILACFNEHGDLHLIRTLQHRGQRRPSNLRHAAATTAAALEMSEPEIFLLPLASETDEQLKSDLQMVFEHSQIHEIRWEDTPFKNASHPDVSPEMIASVRKEPEDQELPLSSSHTFSTLRSDGWATQDFLPLSPEQEQIYPSRGEMRMLRIAKYSRFALAACVIIALGWMGLQIVELIRKPEWTFEQTEAATTAARLSALQQEQAKIQHWDNLMEDRSKGWAAMEMLTRFFPDKSGIMVTSFSHTVVPEGLPAQTKAGFVKQWNISGLARDEALDRLNDLNTRDGITAAFAEVARITGNQSFRTDLPTRSIVVNIRTLEHGAFRPMPPEEARLSDPASYPFVFDLSITQRFEADDPLAMTVATSP